MSKLFAIGQWDTDRKLAPYLVDIRVYKAGDKLVTEDGFTVAVLDEYGDWVSPTMRDLGLKSVIQIEERPDD